MARDIYYRDMNRLNNEYHSLMDQAASVSLSNSGAPTRAEAKLYQRAAEICAQGAANSTRELQTQWMERQRECEQNIRRIVQALNPDILRRSRQADAAPNRAAAEPAADSRGEEDKKPGSEAKKAKRSKNDVISEETIASWFKDPPKQTFEQVAGMEDLKKQMERIVLDIGNSELNTLLEMETVQSFFFYGLPGCGKTFLVEAFANELVSKYGFKYMSLSGSDIHESLVGVTEKIIERMFLEARKNAPCILFVDEIDGVCVNRNSPNLPAHVTSATNAFLTGFNDMSKAEEQIIFIGATNHPKNVDPAMLDRVEMIAVSLPDTDARANYFRMQLGHIIQLEEGFTYEEMSEECFNFSYRDLRKLTSRVKKEIKTRVGEVYGNDDTAAVEAIRNGTFRLDRDTFLSIRDGYPLQPKDESEMFAWASQMEKDLG
ncbi:ATP-binding protein [Butyricicoccus sp.]|uniref:ATP-binding protein n=1 Tax=Butyricicoccus sp. TaxID=2049021 RepID=UPI003F190E1D